MPVLQPSEYNASYFEGNSQPLAHNAGYSAYHRMQYNSRSTRFVQSLNESTGNIFGDMAKGLNVNGRFVGKKMLVLGSAYGFLVKGLRNLGIDAWGLDWSSYAISQADPSIQPYLIEGNALTDLQSMRKNEYAWVISRWFLECVDDTDLPGLITQMNRVSRNQLHIVFPITNPTYYNVKSLNDWQQQPFETGTILIPGDNFDGYVTVIN